MKIFVNVLLLCLVFGSNVFAQLSAGDFEKFQLQALKKADKFGVFVWDVELAKTDPTFNEVFATDSLTKFISSKLKKLKLNPISFEEAGDLPGGPSLDILTTCSFDKTNNYVACNVTARFVQDVQLTRNVKILHYSASTWTKSKIFIIERESLAPVFFEEVENLLKQFAKDYRKVN